MGSLGACVLGFGRGRPSFPLFCQPMSGRVRSQSKSWDAKPETWREVNFVPSQDLNRQWRRLSLRFVGGYPQNETRTALQRALFDKEAKARIAICGPPSSAYTERGPLAWKGFQRSFRSPLPGTAFQRVRVVGCQWKRLVQEGLLGKKQTTRNGPGPNFGMTFPK